MESRSKMGFAKEQSPTLTELPKRIKNFDKLIIPKGYVLLETIEVKSKSGIVMPDGAQASQDYVYHKVKTTGYHVQEEFDKSFKANEYTMTRPGNIVLFLNPRPFPGLHYKDKVYLVVSEGDIKIQIPGDHFKEL